MDQEKLREQLLNVEKAIAAQEKVRKLVPDADVDASLAGLHAARDRLLDELRAIDTEVAGNVTTGGGDFTGRDKTVYGDEVRGLKVGGSVISGDHYHFYHSPAGTDADSLEQAYLHYLLHRTNYLSLAGIDPKAASEEKDARLSLGAVYTALLTQKQSIPVNQQGPAAPTLKERPVSALQELNEHARLVLLGAPGSGKSTFANFVAACLAGERLGRNDMSIGRLTAPLPDHEAGDSQERQPWQHGPLLPVHVTLRDFAARGLPEGEATAAHLWGFLEERLEAAALGDYAPLLRRHLQEEGGLLLLDGLDEVPEAGQRREQIKQVVETFTAAFPRVRVLVTSRTYAYQKQDWHLPGFTETVLAPFSDGQIRRYVDGAYAHIGQMRGLLSEDAQGRAALLKRTIFRSGRLRSLAERPLLLALMVSLHAWRGGSLPDKREELYADAVDLLLEWWENQRVVRDGQGSVAIMQPSLAEWLKVDRERVRALLHRLAYEAHSRQPELVGTADIREAELVSGLLNLSQNPDVKPKRLVEYLSHRAGLLLPRGVGVYTFPHRTFQEYLAACHLTDHDFPDAVAALARADADRWREVALLAGAKAARGAASTLWSLVDALCYAEVPAAAGDLEAQWGAVLAGQALAETGRLEEVSERNQLKLERVRGWLVHVLRSGRLPAVERAAAGRHLNVLGDPRPEVMNVDGMQFCLVPAGPFVMGSADDDSTANDDEKPRHEFDIPYDFWIGRYPVTNAQFEEFVATGGYSQQRYWREAEAAGVWDDGYISERRGSRRDRPAVSETGSELANHPVVGVTWYEANAFARWLGERWQDAGHLPAGWEVVLPSEWEWEKASRGGIEVPSVPAVTAVAGMPLDRSSNSQLRKNENPHRRYPWGDDFDPNRANGLGSGIGRTNGVGAFPAGASPYNCEEMSGNVLEWTRSEQRNYPYQHADRLEQERQVSNEMRLVFRGGCLVNQDKWLRCSARLWDMPTSLYYGLLGFRTAIINKGR